MTATTDTWEYSPARPEEDSDEYSSGYSDNYGSSLPELTNAWWGPNFKSAQTGQLYFLDLQAQWKPRVDLTLVGEFLLGASNAESENEFWDGVMVLADYDIDDHLHVFGQYSFLNDANGEVTGLDQQLQEVSTGVGYHVNQHLELRAEYRHDFSSETEDIDSVSMCMRRVWILNDVWKLIRREKIMMNRIPIAIALLGALAASMARWRMMPHEPPPPLRRLLLPRNRQHSRLAASSAAM